MIELVKHQWKETFRSPVWQKNMILNIIIGLGFFYLALNFVFLGYLGGDILMGVFPGESPISNLNAGLVYYFLVDLFLRFYMQKIPVMGIEPYLHLPIRKRKMINFLLGKSAFNMHNLSLLLIAVPFAIGWIAKYESDSGAVLWIFALYCLTLVNNYLVTYLKKALAEKPIVVLVFGISLIALILLDIYGLIRLSDLSRFYFDSLIESGVWVIPPVLLVAGIYGFVYNYYRQHAYLEALTGGKQKKVRSFSLKALESLDTIGQLIEVELKLIWRNKRPRSVALLSILFVFYGFIYYPQGSNPFGLIVFGLIITGMFLLNYGQFMLSWESNYFDTILAKNIHLKEYVRAKFYLFSAMSLLGFLLSLMYVMYGWRIVLFNFAMLLFNVGINTWLIIFFASISPKKIDLSKGTFFNYEGTGAQQFLLVLPVMGLPVLIFSVFYLFIGETAGLIALMAFGAFGIVFNNVLVDVLAKRLRNKKYQIASNFRE